MLVLAILFGIYGWARSEITRDIPYSEDIGNQFKSFVEEAAKELAGQNCLQATVMSFPKDEKTITVVVECVQYKDVPRERIYPQQK